MIDRYRTTFLWAFFTLVLWKLWLIGEFPLFADEAFYWLESRYPAWGYSDLPPLTAWLIWLTTSSAASSLFSLRIGFLAIASTIPWIVIALARQVGFAQQRWLAGLLALCIPLAASFGVMAMPDVALTVIMLLAVLGIVAGLQKHPWGWCLLGVCLCLGWLSHYRFAALYLAGFAGLCFAGQLRATLRERGFWWAQVGSCLGLIVLVGANATQNFEALQFQAIDRHAFQFQGRALLDPLLQMLLTTPLLFLVWLWSAYKAEKKYRDATVLAFTALSLFAFYWLAGSFADHQRTRFHWPLPAYLIAMPVVAAWLFNRRGWALAVLASGLLGSVMLLGYQTAVALGDRGVLPIKASRFVPENILGWRLVESSIAVDQIAGIKTIVADNFKLAAQIRFALNDQIPVRVMNHPLNQKHGRARQLHDWGMLDTQNVDDIEFPLLLVVDESASAFADLPDWYRGICQRYPGLKMQATLDAQNFRKRLHLFRLENNTGVVSDCQLPAVAYIDQPLVGAKHSRSAPLQISGWAFQESVGVKSVSVLIDGQPIANTDYGLAYPHIHSFWPDSTDPNMPNVGFASRVDLQGMNVGEIVLSMRITMRDEAVTTTPEQVLSLSN